MTEDTSLTTSIHPTTYPFDVLTTPTALALHKSPTTIHQHNFAVTLLSLPRRQHSPKPFAAPPPDYYRLIRSRRSFIITVYLCHRKF